MLQIAFVLLTAFQSINQPAPVDEIKDALAYAEALYYGARFSESIAVLSRVDGTLSAQQGRIKEKMDTKLRLALAYIGTNDTAKAKAYLVEMYGLDSNYVLDPEQFSPKVLSVAAEAKIEQTKVQCKSIESDARTYLDAGKTTALSTLFQASRSKCPALAALQPEAAEVFYRAGVAAYRRGEFSNALSNFDTAVALSPEHELALQYIDLTQIKLQLSEDRLLLQWQRDFDGGHFTDAAKEYRELVSLSNGRNTPATTHATDEYRKALSSLVDTWNRSCPLADSSSLTTLRSQIAELLPQPAFGEDIRAKMSACTESNKTVKMTAAADVQTAPVANAVQADNTCLEMPSQVALTRLKTRVDPTITNELRQYLKYNQQVVVRVKARISESGEVTSATVNAEGNPVLKNVVRNAVTQWKFTPTRDQSGVRCVDTEIPFAIKMTQ